jgi:UDP-N-acetylglucosamine 2-epimerase
VVESVREALADPAPLDRLITPHRFNVLGTFHPISTEPLEAGRQFDALLEALDRVAGQCDVAFILTHPNFEYGSEAIVDRLKRLEGRANYFIFQQLGWKRYLQTMSECDLVVGNSSSLLLEAPILGVPSLVVGTRQRGRFSPPTVRHIETYDSEAIASAVLAMLDSPRPTARHPYGAGDSSARIADILLHVSAEHSRAAMVQKQIAY